MVTLYKNNGNLVLVFNTVKSLKLWDSIFILLQSNRIFVFCWFYFVEGFRLFWWFIGNFIPSVLKLSLKCFVCELNWTVFLFVPFTFGHFVCFLYFVSAMDVIFRAVWVIENQKSLSIVVENIPTFIPPLSSKQNKIKTKQQDIS